MPPDPARRWISKRSPTMAPGCIVSKRTAPGGRGRSISVGMALPNANADKCIVILRNIYGHARIPFTMGLVASPNTIALGVGAAMVGIAALACGGQGDSSGETVTRNVGGGGSGG